MSRRKTPADYHALAKKHGLRWLGPEVTNTGTKTTWECDQGHRWEARFDSIKTGKGCRRCTVRAQAEERRLKPKKYVALAETRGFEWLGPEVPNTATKTGWKCQQGHEWEATYRNIRNGSGCPACVDRARTLRKQPSEYEALAQANGLCWLGPEVTNSKTKTFWECPKGHRWQARFNDVLNGHGCPTCSGLLPKTADDYRVLAQKLAFEWLGPEVPNTATKTGWKCQQGHEWEATYSDILQGHGCSFCSGNVPKTPADYHALAKKHGLRWLGPEVPNNRTKTGWECREGHSWEAPYSSIQQGKRCLVCAGKAPKTPADYHALARKRGFSWLGPEVSNSGTKTGWECDQGHRWQAHYNNISNESGCPTCVDIVNGARVSKAQRAISKMLQGQLNWPCGSYKIDVAITVDQVDIAVEYDSWYWHAGNEKYDKARDKALLRAGWRILRVKTNKLMPTRLQLDQAIAQLVGGEQFAEIVLDDWGKGETRFEM